MDEEFEEVWKALYENGSSQRNKDATKRYWDTLPAAQRHQAFVRITKKARDGKFLQYDPIRAIKENIRKYQAIEPTNLNQTARGGAMLSSGQAEIAFYNGSWGIYSQEDIKMFHLLTKKEYEKQQARRSAERACTTHP